MAISKKTNPVQQVEPDEKEPTSVAGLVLENRLGYALRRAQLTVFKHFNEAMQEYEIRPAQFSSLVVIEGYPGITQTNLAKVLDIDPPRIVSLINNLEERGLALRVRCKRDRRSHGIFLSKKGEALTEQLKGLAEESDVKATQSLSEIERRQLLSLLVKIYTSDTGEE
ncbi:MarR family winged helix-turn-helix transcriptional regulator [Halomonas sp. Mc5H-6]|uniref:MarR family winged helix-turn-helix transcriptional regulator n=1 Tax=Halomonas sp. Mc5H-6 TaxID=2954500 RepID=UPI002097AE22|nr:MarR family winged helix-turn-helix transcriptional regulator [Halomonas sp. Mc5H-6]MCO7245958.1 MarR family winged helix-turn-helix transcriptional regulator [Halomonas sp. Mc5H-6]